MRDDYNRDITVLDLVLTPIPTWAPVKPIQYYCQKMHDAFRNPDNPDATAKWSRDRKMKTFIRDMQMHDEYAVILLWHTNGNARAASYAHLDNNTPREDPLAPREGRGETVHLLISFNSLVPGQARFRVLLENSSKISRAHVQSYLNSMFKMIRRQFKESDFKAQTPDGAVDRNGNFRTAYYENGLDLEGHPSEDFMAMIRSGKLQGITLVTRRGHAAFSEASFVTSKRQELHLQPISGSWGEKPIQRLREALTLGTQEHYEAARVVFEASDGRPHTATVSTTTRNIIGDAFIRKHRLVFEQSLPEAERLINSDISGRMLGLL